MFAEQILTLVNCKTNPFKKITRFKRPKKSDNFVYIFLNVISSLPIAQSDKLNLQK